MLVIVVIEEEAGGVERPEATVESHCTHAESLVIASAVGRHRVPIQAVT
jgi:hypothetical protein